MPVDQEARLTALKKNIARYDVCVRMEVVRRRLDRLLADANRRSEVMAHDRTKISARAPAHPC